MCSRANERVRLRSNSLPDRCACPNCIAQMCHGVTHRAGKGRRPERSRRRMARWASRLARAGAPPPGVPWQHPPPESAHARVGSDELPSRYAERRENQMKKALRVASHEARLSHLHESEHASGAHHGGGVFPGFGSRNVFDYSEQVSVRRASNLETESCKSKDGYTDFE